MNIKEFGLLITLGTLFYVLFGIFQMVLGIMGIAHYFGAFGVILALAGLFIYRFTLPFTIGTFFGAMAVLDVNWFFALLLTLPGVVYLIPGLMLTVLAPIASRVKRQSPQPTSPYDDGDVIEGTAVHVDDEGDKK